MERETKTVSSGTLRDRMRARGITVGQLAEAAGMRQADMSAALRGKVYVGAKRRAQIESAILALGLDKEPQPDGGPKVLWRITAL